jgi:hypothetical protein
MLDKDKVKTLEEHYNYFEISDLTGLSYDEVRMYSEDSYLKEVEK